MSTCYLSVNKYGYSIGNKLSEVVFLVTEMKFAQTFAGSFVILCCRSCVLFGLLWAILLRRRPYHLLILSVRLSVCLMPPPRGKTKRPMNTKLGRKVPGTPAPRGPISRSRGQRSRSQRLIVWLAKNPHNFVACCPINLIFGRWRKDPLPPCTG